MPSLRALAKQSILAPLDCFVVSCARRRKPNIFANRAGQEIDPSSDLPVRQIAAEAIIATALSFFSLLHSCGGAVRSVTRQSWVTPPRRGWRAPRTSAPGGVDDNCRS